MRLNRRLDRPVDNDSIVEILFCNARSTLKSMQSLTLEGARFFDRIVPTPNFLSFFIVYLLLLLFFSGGRGWRQFGGRGGGAKINGISVCIKANRGTEREGGGEMNS